MLRLYIFSFCIFSVYGYFTLPGKCPTNVPALDDFKLQDFVGTWHQVYHYSSDGQQKNNCSKVEVSSQHGAVHFNVSRVDRGLFHRYSIASVQAPGVQDKQSVLKVEFEYKNAPRRLMKRKYEVQILATNYNYYATAYTCQYSPLIDKHFIYVWILSRRPIFNEVSKDLALRPLSSLSINESNLVKDDLTKCTPKYYEDVPTEPFTFRYPVPI